MFIYNAKCHCCNGTFIEILFTLLLAKNIQKIQIMLNPLESAFHWLFCVKIFILIGLFF